VAPSVCTSVDAVLRLRDCHAPGNSSVLKRLPEDQLEDESLNAVASFFNSQSWEFNRQIRDKSGIDGEVEIVHGIERTGRLLKCQVKAGTSYISSENEDALRIRVETKYLEHWSRMTAPVLLLFYHPTTHQLFWRAIKEHLALHPSLLKQGTDTCVIVFDKNQDNLTADSLALIEQVESKKFSYSTILIEPSRTELGWSNWFPILKFPSLWAAPTTAGITSRSHIAPYLDRDYTFIVQENRLITLSNLRDQSCELRHFVDTTRISLILQEDLSSPVFVELLNQTVSMLARQRDLLYQFGRLYFPSSVLKSEDTKTFSYVSLKGQEEARQKIYVRPLGRKTENQHHAVRLSFIQHLCKWFLVIEPDWYFSYPFGKRPSPREIGARITSVKAGTYNKDYLYLIHFWRQFLSNNSNTITIPCSWPDDNATLDVQSVPLEFEFQFRFFNDYVGPKEQPS
jgi:hypothetical protein